MLSLMGLISSMNLILAHVGFVILKCRLHKIVSVDLLELIQD